MKKLLWKLAMWWEGKKIAWKKRKERCAYCGWYLHPQLLFKGIQRPMKQTYCQDKNGLFICSNCAHNPNSNY